MDTVATTRPTVPRPKIEVPRVPAASVLRPRLLDLLPGGRDAAGPLGEQRRLIYHVCAPAGFGKSTLLATQASALRKRGVPVAWVTCDRHDNDPAQLWTTLLAAMTRALEHAVAGSHGAAVDAFARLVPPREELEPAFLTEFVEAVEALPAPIVLMVDDAHEIVDPVVLTGLDELVRHLPDQLVLVLGCRYDPPLALPRLRLDGRLREVRARDLAFTSDEAAAMLRAQRVTLSERDTTLLLQRTEGWPAALRLAALSLADDRDADPAAFVPAFAGDDRGVADYLVGEVLSRMTGDTFQFLLDTCVAEELTVDLAVTLSGRSDAGSVLDRLERANALVTRLGRRDGWYRYHALLRSFLLAELRRRDADAVHARHARASEWFADANLGGPALEHAGAAADDAAIIRLLRRFGLRLLLSGTGGVVREVLADASPTVSAAPEAALVAAVDALERGDVLAADRMLRPVQDAAFDDDPWLDGLRDAAVLYRARVRGDVGVLSDVRYARDPQLARRTNGGHEDDQDVELLLLANRGMLRIAGGDPARASTDLRTALELATRSGRDYLALHCLVQLTGVAASVNDFQALQDYAERAISFAAERGWGSSPRMTYAYSLAAWGAHLRLDLETARRWAAMAIAVLGEAMPPEVDSVARSAEALITFDRHSQRRAALQRMREHWATLDAHSVSPALICHAHMAELRMCLTLGEHHAARAVVDRIERLRGQTGDTAVLRGLLFIGRNRITDARRVVAPVLRGDSATVATTHEVTAWLIEAAAATRLDEHTTAHAALLEALRVAAPTGAPRPFYDMGQSVRDLLIGAAGRAGTLELFRTRILDAWTTAQAWQEQHAGATGRYTEARPMAIGATPAQPLTLRELDMLRDLPSMLTVEEIAAAHTVSVNTVKTHLKSIYRKLDVGSRREAVAAAQQLGVL